MVPRPTEEIELGRLTKPGAVIWSYTGMAYEVTLGWKPRRYGSGQYIAVLRDNGTVRWLPREIIKKQRQYNHATGQWHYRWQITPKPVRGMFM